MIVKYISQLVAIATLGAILIGCQSTQRVTKTEELVDPSSNLLQILVQTSDFSDDVEWFSSHVEQRVEVPNLDNHYRTETVLHDLTGLVRPDHNIVLVHIVQSYEQPVSWITKEPIELSKELETQSFQEFSISFHIKGEYNNYKCIKTIEKNQFKTTVCKIIFGYEGITSTLYLYASATLSNNSLESIIEQAMIRPNAEITEIIKEAYTSDKFSW